MEDFSKIFKYDETSSTYLRWIDDYRIGRGGKPVRRVNSSEAGSLTSQNKLSIGFRGKLYSINQVVWILHHGEIPKDRNVMHIDGNHLNCSIANLELNFIIEDGENKYDRYLSEFFQYDEESPSSLRWRKIYNRGSNIKIGDVAGSLDGGYWRVHALGRALKAHKIVWALHNNFENQDGMHIDHKDGNPSNNNISNLRLVPEPINARNKPMLKNNRSGIHGVCFQVVKTKAGNYIERYVAGWRTLEGRPKTKCFSVEKYGKELAEFLAQEYRQHQIDLLNLMGAGYTERHGTKK